MQEKTELQGFMMWLQAPGFGKAATAAKLEEKWQCLSVYTHGSDRHWKSTDISKQWDIIIQKCEMQGGFLLGLKPSRNLVVSGLGDPRKHLLLRLNSLLYALALVGLLKRSGCSTGSGRYRSCFKPSHQLETSGSKQKETFFNYYHLICKEEKQGGGRQGKAVGAGSSGNRAGEGGGREADVG